LLILASLTLALPFLVGASRSLPAEIVVHLIDARTGAPIPRKPVRVWSLNPPRQWDGYLEEKTGPNGTAVFQLRSPLPESVIIGTGMGGYWEECRPNDRAGFEVSEILTSGGSKMGACLFNIPNIDRKYQARPGEVYFFVVHLSFWEHLIHCGKWGCR